MKFILIPILLWVLSQTIKFLIRVARGGSLNYKNTAWIYLWASGAPSTHAALLSCALWIVWRYYGLGPLFGFSFVVVLLLIYDIALQRKWELLLENYFQMNNEPALKRLVNEGKLLDISGHTVLDIGLGALLGFSVGVLLSFFAIIP